MNVSMKPIGTMKSLFHFKNGTPRQASVCNSAPGILTIEKSVFNNPEHSLEGLEEYSHAWVIFVFHKNNNAHRKAKVKPPRLDGKRTGVFSSRSPYRPNNIGLSLVKIEKIEGPTIHFSGVDMIDGTPVLDVKPYIPEYDCPVSDMILETAQKQQPSEVEAGNHDPPSVIPGLQMLESSRDGTDQANSASSISPSGMDNLERGFYAISAALDKAGEMLTSKSPEAQDNIEIKQSHMYLKAECSKNDSSDNILLDAESEAEDQDDLDAFLGGIISQAAHSLSSERPPDNNSHPNACEGLILTDTNASFKSSRNGNNELECTALTEHKNKTDFETNRQCMDSNLYISREVTADKKFDLKSSPVVAPWLLNPPVQKLRVTFTTEALQQLHQFSKSSPDPHYRLQLLSSPGDTETAIRDVLREEPRSVYRRQHCQDSLYFFTVDVVHVTCWFDGDTAQVVRLKPVATVTQLQKKIAENS